MPYIDLSIFDKSNRAYLQINKINEWMFETTPRLKDLAAEDLLRIFIGLANLKIFDNKFVKCLCDAMSNKLADLSYSKLTSILYALQEIKHTKNIDFIEKIVTRLTQFESLDNGKPLPNAIWFLSKIGFQDEEFFEAWIKLAISKVNNFNKYELTKSIQAIATLKLFNANFINLLLHEIKNVITECEPRTQLNIAFYLSMISVNSLDNNRDPLKLDMNAFIKNTMQALDLSFFRDNIAKKQILQIHSSKIFTVSEETFIRLSQATKQQDSITTSVIQKKVEFYINRVCTKFKVISEYYEPNTASFIDLKVERVLGQPEFNVYGQIEGPTHYFINHQPYHDRPVFNGATEFRNGLHKLYDIKPFIVSYFAIDNRDYYPSLLEALHTFPEGYSRIIAAETLSTTVASSVENTGVDLLSTSTKQKKTTPPKAKKPVVNKNHDNENFDRILAEYKLADQKIQTKELSYNSIEKKYSKTNKLSITPKMLLEGAIKIADLKDIELILQYHNDIVPGGLNSEWHSRKENMVELDKLTLNKLSNNYKNNIIYHKIYSLFLSYNYQVTELDEKHLKALIFAYGYGDAEMFQSFLDLFPNNDSKIQLMEYFLVNCGSLNHVEIASLLLLKHIDINSCYSRESSEVLYALATGLRHNGKPIPNRDKIYSDLYKILIKTSTTLNSVEDLFQAASGGILDKGEGIPEGRGVTALHLSSYREQNSEIQLFLLKNDANPNTINKDGFTPLITALLAGSEKAALQILSFQPNVNLKAIRDLNAAHIAAKHGFVNVIQKIIELGGDLNTKIRIDKVDEASKGFMVMSSDRRNAIQFNADETPLWIALKLGHVEVAKRLIDAKANLDSHLDVKVIPYLGAPSVITKALKFSILTYCIINYPELVKQLLRNGAKTNDDRLECSPLMVIGEFSNPETQRNNAKVCKDRHPEKAFNKALKLQELNIFEELLLHGADINFKDRDGDTVDVYVQRPNIISSYTQMLKNIQLSEFFIGVNIVYRKKLIEFIKGAPIEIAPDAIITRKAIMYSEHIEASSRIIEDNSFLIEGDEEYSSAKQKEGNKIHLTQLSIDAKAIDIIVDTIRLVNRPNIEITYKLIYDVSYMSNMLTGQGTPITLLLSTPHIANKITHGKYTEAAMDMCVSFGFVALSGIINYMNIPLVKELYPAVQQFMIEYHMLKNMELLYEEITDPDNGLKSAEAYQDVKDGFLNILYSFQEMLGVSNHEEVRE